MAAETSVEIQAAPIAHGRGGSLRSVIENRAALWSAFAVVHLLLGGIALAGHGLNLGDVLTIYRPWAEFARSGSGVVGIDLPWVYPIGALPPIMLPLLFGADAYGLVWVLMVTALDAAALAILTAARRPRSLLAGWWWMGFLALLGPVAIARLDAVSAPIVIVGLLWLGFRHRIAVTLITVATWIKVWPVAVLLALVVALRDRMRVVGTAVATSLVFVIVALVYGAGWHILSFITMQTVRGVQIEAPVALPWMWLAALRIPGNAISYDQQLNTFEVQGPGVAAAASVMTPLLALSVAAIVVLGIRALRHGASSARVLPVLVLALVATLIVFNKVGSPQYMTWLAAPVVAGLVARGRAFRTPAALALVIAALTQAFYPYLYDWLLIADPVMLAVLTARNVCVCILLAWSARALWTSARAGDAHERDLRPEAVWPFGSRAPAVR